jgi:TRAP transporter 4TM/12TM fusion protein
MSQRTLTGLWEWVINIISALIIFIVLDQVFYFNVFSWLIEIETSYLYILLGFYVSTVFLLYPMASGEKFKIGVFFTVDIILFLLTLAIGLLFAVKGLEIYYKGWMFIAPRSYSLVGFMLWLLVLEATRRSQGWALTLIISSLSLYPLFANYMPGFLNGIGFNIVQTTNYHAFSVESLIGLPMKVTGNLVIGFMIFGIVLVITGGGSFFMDFALSFMGTSRGGAAKVSVISSALFGTMSGSAISNVITTGTITIPAMIKTGYPPYYAGAVEACASTGGVLMPPVMGATAFLVAEFLNIPYLHVALAAAVPSFLYYLGLLIQVDAHAARNGLKGLSREELPSLKNTLRKGWYYVGALLVLVLFLFLRLERQSPFYASLFLIICSNFRKETRLDIRKIRKLLYDNIQTLAGLIAVISAIGLIIGSLSVTGVAHGLTREIIHFSGKNIYLMAFMGAITSYILGMGITITACYVLLAITLAPPLIQGGLDPLAVHLFLMYCGMLSYITLPVATAVYAGAALARATIADTGFAAMRLGIVTYFIPFFFLFNPALILKGGFFEILQCIFTAGIGTFLIASSLGKYMIGLGTLTPGINGKLESYLLIPALFISGLLLAFPEKWTDLCGILLGAACILVFVFLKKTHMEDIAKAKAN